MKRYKVLKDYKLKEIVPGTHLVLLKGATVELSGEGGFGDGAETFEEIKEPESQEGIDCPGCADTYTELPDGLCVKCRPQEKELAKAEYRAERSRDQAVLDEAIKASKPQEKEECKHHFCNADRCFVREDCSHKNVVAWCGDCENVVSPREKEQLKPSEWINQRMKELVEHTYKQSDIRSQTDVDNVREWAEDKAVLDFLDSVAEGKYKL